MRIELPTNKTTEINHAEAGKRVRALREKSGVSLRQLARDMKLSAPFLSDLERGRRNWSVENFKKAVQLLQP